MNKYKNAIVRLSPVAQSDFKVISLKNFNWSEVRFTSLGIYLPTESGEIPDLNYPERNMKITTILDI